MLSAQLVTDALAKIRQQSRRGLDVAPPPTPEQPPVLDAAPGVNWGETIGGLGEAVVGKLAQRKPRSQPLPALGNAPANNVLGSAGLADARGKTFGVGTTVGPRLFAQGGTLPKRPGETAIVGDGGEPELLVQGRQGTHVLPMSILDGLDFGQSQQEVQPRPVVPPQSPPAPVPPSVLSKGLPLSILDGFKESWEARRNEPSPPAAQGAPAVPGGLPLSLLDALPSKGFEPSRVPMTGRVKAAPLPGEEDVNDARVRGRLDAAGGYVEGEGANTRRRIADPAAHLDRSADYDEDPRNAEEDADGSRWKSGAKTAALLGLQVLSGGGSPISAATAAAGGFGLGAAMPGTDERILQQQRAGTNRRRAAEARGRESERLKLEGERSDIRYRDAMTEYTRTTKKDEAESRDADRRKRQLLGQLRAMPTVDPANHAAFLSSWQKEFGEPFDVQGYNDKKSNFVVRGLITDPAKPQEKHDVAINLATGETKDLGLSGFVVPRDEKGMSESEYRTSEDRRRLLEANLPLIEARVRQANANTEKMLSEMRTGITGAAKRTFDLETDSLQAELRSIRSQRTAIERRMKESKLLPSDGQEMLDKLDEEEKTLQGQVEAARQRALGTRQAPRSTPSGGGTKQRISRRNFGIVREDNPSLRDKSDAEVEAALRAAGVEVID